MSLQQGPVRSSNAGTGQNSTVVGLERPGAIGVVQSIPDDGNFVLIDEFPIDLFLSENHVYEAEVTEFPVEDGSDITDNIRPKPVTVTIEGLVSDSPIGSNLTNKRTSQGQGPDSGIQPSSEAYLRLVKVFENREPVTITTALNVYESMALKSLTIPVSSGQPHLLRFHATFVQIQIVTTNRAARVAMPRASQPVLQGHIPAGQLPNLKASGEVSAGKGGFNLKSIAKATSPLSPTVWAEAAAGDFLAGW